MSGLDELKKNEVENVFSFTLNKFESSSEFLTAFEHTLIELYQLSDYHGDWDSAILDKAVEEYVKKTDAIKKDYQAKKITKVTGSSMTIFGAILSFTPLAPVGWGLAGAGAATNAITDVVDLADKHKQKEWETAKNRLRDLVNNPFEGTNFKKVYDELMKTYSNLKSRVALDDYSVILQGLGWNYFAFRKENMTHEAAMKQLLKTCDLFRTHRYMISDDLKTGKQNAIQDMQNLITPSCNSLVSTAGALAMIGLSAGVAVAAITAGINVAAQTFQYAEAIAHGLLAIGNFATKTLNMLIKVSPVIAIIGGVASIVFDSMALSNIDKTFKPYYDYKDECVVLITNYKHEYKKNNDIIIEMIKFMDEDRADKVQSQAVLT
ncbi:hypothetical protein ACXHQJ_19085 [Vibrio vulnificus]